MTSVTQDPVCFRCRHFRDTESGLGCKAFPDENGIPDIILLGNDHSEPVEGDHGIQFEPKA